MNYGDYQSMQTLKFATYIKLLIRSLAFVSIPYFVLFIAFSLVIESPMAWGSLITQSLGFGVITTFAIGTQLNKSESYKPKPNAKHIANDRFETALGIDELASLLENDSYFGNARQQVVNGSVVLVTEPSFSGWGETVKIVSDSQNDEGLTEYAVTSSPLLKSTFLDRRKNVKNLHKLKALVANNTLSSLHTSGL